MAAEETSQVDFLARTLEMRHIAVLRDQRLAALAADGPSDQLCSPRCEGVVQIAVPGYEGCYAATCPFHATATCPQESRRLQAADREFLAELYHGKELPAQQATRAGLTETLRAGVGRWIDTAPRRLQQGSGLIISGKRRTGKTCACTPLALAAHAAGASCCFVKSSRAFDELNDWQMHLDRLDPDAKFLFWDDWFMDHREPRGLSRFFEIMDERTTSGLCTFFTTNLTRNEIEADATHERFLARMLERNLWIAAVGPERWEEAKLEDWS